MKKAAPELMIALLLGVTVFFWASAFAGIRAGLEAYSPGHVALARLLVASVVLLVYAAVVRMPMPEVRDLPFVALAGFLAFTVYHVALNFGEVTVTAGPASVIVNTAPIFTALLATAFLGERLRPLGWFGMVVGFLGAAMIGLGEGEGLRFDPGAFIILVSAVSVSVYFVTQKPYLRKYGALNFTAYAIWAGTIFALVFLPGLPAAVWDAPLDATLALLYLGVFPTAVAYVTYAYVFAHLPASRGVSFLYLVPAVAFLIAWVWLGEVPSALSMIGGVVTLVGVLLVKMSVSFYTSLGRAVAPSAAQVFRPRAVSRSA